MDRNYLRRLAGLPQLNESWEDIADPALHDSIEQQIAGLDQATQSKYSDALDVLVLAQRNGVTGLEWVRGYRTLRNETDASDIVKAVARMFYGTAVTKSGDRYYWIDLAPRTADVDHTAAVDPMALFQTEIISKLFRFARTASTVTLGSLTRFVMGRAAEARMGMPPGMAEQIAIGFLETNRSMFDRLSDTEFSMKQVDRANKKRGTATRQDYSDMFKDIAQKSFDNPLED